MRPGATSSPEPHFGVGFCPRELPEQLQTPQNHTISQSDMQAICLPMMPVWAFKDALYNTPVQATGADGFKLALCLIARGLQGVDARVVNTFTRRNNNRGQRWHRGSGGSDCEGMHGKGIRENYPRGSIRR